MYQDIAVYAQLGIDMVRSSLPVTYAWTLSVAASRDFRGTTIHEEIWASCGTGLQKKKVVEESDQKLLYFILVSLVIENLIAAMNFNCVWMSSESLPDSVL